MTETKAGSRFWSRVREARLVRVVAVYLAASWLVLQVTSLLREELELPQWVTPVAVVLLLAGLVIISATAWVQSQSATAARARREELPDSWEIDLADMKESVVRGRLPHLTWARSILGGAVAFSLLFGATGVYVLVKDRGRTFAPTEAVAENAGPGIAVLPFTVTGPGLEVWREGMVDLLSTNLDGAAGLRAIDSRTVMARWRERVRDPGTVDLQSGLEVARRTGARYALMGKAVAIGPDVRLVADVYDIHGGASLGSGQVEGPPDSVLALVDGLSIEILRGILQGRRGPFPNVSLAEVTTRSLPALRAYLEGEFMFRRSEFDKAIPAYERALKADSTFALALYHLAVSHSWAAQIGGSPEAEYLQRAARLADRLPEREALLVRGRAAYIRNSPEQFEFLRRAVRQYPEDAEAWWLLGDSYFHYGDAALLEEDEAEWAFSKAVELDANFAPAYIHLVHDAFLDRPDSAETARRIESYGALARGTDRDRGNRLAFDLAFGDSATQAGALERLHTVPPVDLFGAARCLSHARFLPVQEKVLAELRRRPFSSDGTVEAFLLYGNNVARGRLADALARLEDPLLPQELRRESVYTLHALGLPVGRERLTTELTIAPADTAVRFGPFYAGAYAADEGRWTDHAASVAQLRNSAKRSLARGDSTAVGHYEGAAEALEGYALWRKGAKIDAPPVLERAQRRATGADDPNIEPYGTNAVIRWWLADLALESGQPREAVRFFMSFGRDSRRIYYPIAAFHLGKVYEDLGETDRAREAYEYFATAWKDADPELQPMVSEARKAAARLRST